LHKLQLQQFFFKKNILKKIFLNIIQLFFLFFTLSTYIYANKDINVWLLDKPYYDNTQSGEYFSGIGTLIEDFESDNNIDININNINESSYSQLLLGFLSSNVDIIEVKIEWLANFYKLGLIADFDSKIDKSKYFKSYFNYLPKDIKSIYPFTLNSYLLVLDNFKVKKYGLKIPNKIVTLDGIIDISEQLKIKNRTNKNKFIPIGVSREDVGNFFLNFSQNIDSASLKYLQNLVHNPIYNQQTEEKLYQKFLRDENPYIFLFADYNHYKSFYNFKKDFTYYPLPTDKISLSGTVLVINKRSKKYNMASKFAKYMSSYKSQRYIMNNMKIAVPYKKVWENELISKNKFNQAILKSLQKETNVFRTKNFYSNYNMLINKLVEGKLNYSSFKHKYFVITEKNINKNGNEKVWFSFSKIVIYILILTLIAYLFLKNRRFKILDFIILPVIVIISIVYILPILDTIISILSSKIDNTVDISILINSLINTFSISILKLITTICIGVTIAYLAIFLKEWERNIIKVIFLIPYLTSHNATAYIWKYFFSMLPINPILYSKLTAWSAVVVMETWKSSGFIALILLLFWEAKPKWYYDVFSIYSNNHFNYLRYVLLPISKKPLMFVVILQIINSFQMFDQLYILGGVTGGAYRYIQTVVMLLYEYGFYKFEFTNAIYVSLVYTIIVLSLGTGIKKLFARGNND